MNEKEVQIIFILKQNEKFLFRDESNQTSIKSSLALSN